jgi:predicted RNA binding protein YcfA (HicA-like mRNA interferase family)
MAKPRKSLEKILGGSRNVRFEDFVALIEAFDFQLARVNGSHHIFTHPEVEELVNVQKVRGKAKPYQVRQFLQLVEEYDLSLGEDS